MSVESDLRTYLQTQTALTALVGARVRPYSPQGETLAASSPAITYRRISSDHEHNLQAAAGWAAIRLQFDCIATTESEALSVAEALRGELSGYSGTSGSTTFSSITWNSMTSLFVPNQFGGEQGTHQVICEITAYCLETIPTFS